MFVKLQLKRSAARSNDYFAQFFVVTLHKQTYVSGNG
jgi:hypothetical protein